MSEWIDIATAPKDGTRVFIWVGSDEPVVAHYETGREWGKESDPVNDWVTEWRTVSGYDAGWDRAGNPTHWMPLPEPPK